MASNARKSGLPMANSWTRLLLPILRRPADHDQLAFSGIIGLFEHGQLSVSAYKHVASISNPHKKDLRLYLRILNKTASPTRTQLRDVARSASDEAIPRAHWHTEHGGLLRFARNVLKVLNCQSYNFLCIKERNEGWPRCCESWRAYYSSRPSRRAGPPLHFPAVVETLVHDVVGSEV